ncbi:unnamed protein product, partial [Allacma fusca]
FYPMVQWDKSMTNNRNSIHSLLYIGFLSPLRDSHCRRNWQWEKSHRHISSWDPI